LPPMVAEVIQINQFSKRFRNLEERKRIASKLYRSLKKGTYVKKFTKKADQYFPKYSLGHIAESVDSFYYEKFEPIFDKLEITTYDELGFDEAFSELKSNSSQNYLNLSTKELGKDLFFTKKNTQGDSDDQPDAFYYFSGVGAADPIFEMTYMIERTNGGRYATPEVSSLLNLARFEKDKKKYHSYLKKIQVSLLKSYLMVPLRHSSPVFHYKGIFKPSEDFYSGNLDFWDWHRVN